ncbi:MAG: hypothetical protein WBF38_06830 [Nitrosotalea sp.]
MRLTKNVLYGIGICLIVAGFLMVVFGEIPLNAVYHCPANSCNFSPQWIYQNIIIPTIIVYSGLAVMIAGGIFIIVGKKARHSINNGESV